MSNRPEFPQTPAFPLTTEPLHYINALDAGFAGMSLRDYFAAKALQGMLASWPENSRYRADRVAELAYEFAYAMLAAREADKSDET